MDHEMFNFSYSDQSNVGPNYVGISYMIYVFPLFSQNSFLVCDKSSTLAVNQPDATPLLYPGLGPAVTTAGRESGD